MALHTKSTKRKKISPPESEFPLQKLRSYIVRKKNLSTEERKVLLALLDQAKKGRSLYAVEASTKILQEKTGLSKEELLQAKADLKEKGMLRAQRGGSSRGQRASRYSLQGITKEALG